MANMSDFEWACAHREIIAHFIVEKSKLNVETLNLSSFLTVNEESKYHVTSSQSGDLFVKINILICC